MNLMNTQNLMVASKYNLLKRRKYKVLSIDTEKGEGIPKKDGTCSNLYPYQY